MQRKESAWLDDTLALRRQAQRSIGSPLKVQPDRASEGAVAQRWYLLALLVLGYAVYNLDKNVTSVLIEPIKHEFRLSDTTLSLLTGLAMTVPFAISCVPVGMLADRFNRRGLLAALVLGWSAMTGFAGFSSNAAMLFVSRSSVGALEAGYSPVVMSMLTDSFPRRLRPTAMGIFGRGAPGGLFLGMSIGGYAAAAYGWRYAFFAAGLPGAAVALLIATTIREPLRGRYDPAGAAPGQRPTIAAALANLFLDRALFHVAIGMSLCVVLPAAMAIWTPSFLMRVHGFPLRQAGLYSAFLLGF